MTQPLYAAGMQCAKRLYLQAQEAKKATAPKPSSADGRDLLATAEKLRELARGAFPHGVAVPGDSLEERVQATTALLKSGEPTVLFDAAIRHGDAVISADVCQRHGDGTFDLYEVKSGSSVKPRHVHDLALQVWVLENALSATVERCTVLHPNPGYRHVVPDSEVSSKEYPIHSLFKSADVTSRVRRQMDRVETNVASYTGQALDPATLELGMGTHCWRPFPCPYIGQCEEEPRNHFEAPIWNLPGLGATQEAALLEAGIQEIAHLDPKKSELTFPQKIATRAVLEEGVVLDATAKNLIEQLEAPVHFIAVGCVRDVLPVFPASRPWHAIPFAWHAQTLFDDDSTESSSWTCTERVDPRQAFCETLADLLRGGGTAVYWQNTPDRDIRTLLEDEPEWKSSIRTLLTGKRFLMSDVVGSRLWHVDFDHDLGLIPVAERLANFEAPDLPLRVDRDMADAFRKIQAPRLHAKTRTKLSREIDELLAWQTEAMLRIYYSLITL